MPPFPSTSSISLPFPHRNAFERSYPPPLPSPFSERSPCRSFTSPTLLSAPSATVSGVIGWPCILSLSVTAQACGSSSARHGEKGARFTLEKNFLPFRNIRYAFSKHRQPCDWCCCTRIFSSDRCLFDKKSNSTLLVNVAGNIARVNSVGFFIRIYIRTCDTDGYKYIYIYIFVTSYERQSLQSDRRKLFSSKEGRKSEGRGYRSAKLSPLFTHFQLLSTN